MKDGFLRVAAATPSIKVADCKHNVNNMIELAIKASEEKVSLVVFPELSITAYTCGDLFLQKRLLDAAEESVLELARKTASLDLIVIAGLPVRDGGALYNCAAVIYHGKILGLVPKQNIPNYSEFYELRHFSKGPAEKNIIFAGEIVPLGYRLLFACRSLPEFCLGIEICEDLWVPMPPSSKLATSGATVIANLSASDEIIGKAPFRRSLVESQSARLISAYIYSDAGEGESTTDMVFGGHNLIAENGAMLCESKLFTTGLTVADIDLQRLLSERRRTSTYPDPSDSMTTIWFDLPVKPLELKRKIAPFPFVPSSTSDLEERCEEILTLQACGLATRLKHTNCKTAIVGLSGGLDSTLALIVTVHAFDMLSLDKKGIIAVTMPGFGTTSRTKNNAQHLANAYGVTLKEISIDLAVKQHFLDIGQDENVHDVTYENSQARERTQVLMDIANQKNGLVVGTGDLSELALGWATYNGDHMSMYAVNASIPKTLVRHLTEYESNRTSGKLREVLKDVLNTPVSPELLPPSNGEISQVTEDIVGPYALHDFFLYYMVRYGYTPKKIFRIALLAFGESYKPQIIKKWLIVFIKRFFSQQFKRSCLPDGPKVGTVTLSPRGDFRMPSDASVQMWLDEAEKIEA